MDPVSEAIYDDIIGTMENSYGYRVFSCTQICRGYLNLKWRVDTDIGPVVVKQYHPYRYPQHKVMEIEEALMRQSVLQEQGVKCPKIHYYGESPIIKSPKGENFIIMDFYEGEIVKADSINSSQMFNLGREVALMHDAANKLFKPSCYRDGKPSGENLQKKWQEMWIKAREDRDQVLLQRLDTIKKIIDSIDINGFDNCRHSWIHSDLWADNILFEKDRVSCIVDFDRNCYSLAERDVGEVLLSLALYNDNLERNLIVAFLEGYQQVCRLTEADIIRGFKLYWCLKALWRAHIGMEECERGTPTERFVYQTRWLTAHWFELEDIVG